jgi:hypothetical protein
MSTPFQQSAPVTSVPLQQRKPATTTPYANIPAAELFWLHEAKSFLNPRWPFMAAVFLAPFVLIGNAIEQWYRTNPCTYGGLCQLDRTTSPLEEALIICGAFLVFWTLAYFLGNRALVEYAIRTPEADALSLMGVYTPPRPPRRGTARFFWEISHFARVRHVIVGVGIVAVIALIVDGFRHTLTAQSLSLGGIVVIVATMTLIWWLRLDERIQPVYAEYLKRREEYLHPPTSPIPFGVSASIPPQGSPSVPPMGSGPSMPYGTPYGDPVQVDPPYGGSSVPPPLPYTGSSLPPLPDRMPGEYLPNGDEIPGPPSNPEV